MPSCFPMCRPWPVSVGSVNESPGTLRLVNVNWGRTGCGHNEAYLHLQQLGNKGRWSGFLWFIGCTNVRNILEWTYKYRINRSFRIFFLSDALVLRLRPRAAWTVQTGRNVGTFVRNQGILSQAHDSNPGRSYDPGQNGRYLTERSRND